MNSSTKQAVMFGAAFMVAWIVIALVGGAVTTSTIIQALVGGAAFGGVMFAGQKV